MYGDKNLMYYIETDERKSDSIWYRNVVCPMHIQHDFEFVYVSEGELPMQIGQQMYRIPAGHAIFVEPFEPHGFPSGSSNQCNVTEFDPKHLPDLFDLLKSNVMEQRVLRLRPEAAAYLELLLPPKQTEWQDLPDSYMRTVAQVYGHEFLTCGTFQPYEKIYDDIYLGAMQIIFRNLVKPLSLQSVAKTLGICPETLSRKFSEKAGMTFLHYIHYLRVCKVIFDMRRGVAVIDAAMHAGFSSICSFNRIFRKVTGMTPTEFIKRMPEDGYNLMHPWS